MSLMFRAMCKGQSRHLSWSLLHGTRHRTLHLVRAHHLPVLPLDEHADPVPGAVHPVPELQAHRACNYKVQKYELTPLRNRLACANVPSRQRQRPAKREL